MVPDKEPEKKQKAQASVVSKPAKPSVKSKQSIDFSSIDPEKEWECFGMITDGHPECVECPFAEPCRSKKSK